MSTDLVDLHDLTGVYAAGALPAQEQSRVEEHLSACRRCAQETRELLETAALLGVAAAAPPPPHLRALVLAEAATTAQLPVLLSARSTASDRPSPFRSWPLRAAACLAALTIGIATYAGLPDSGSQTTDVQAQPGSARTLTVTTTAASATVRIDPSTARMSFTARGLPTPGPGRTYQLWLLDSTGPRSAGTFALSPSGEAAAVIEEPRRADTLLVTDEPAGGSAQPSTQPVLALDLRQA